MEWVEFGKTIANLGLVPALGIACVVLWRKWWDMVDALVAKYEGVIARKDQQLAAKDGVIAQLQKANEALGEKRLDEYRAMNREYRNCLETTNTRDAELARGQHTNQRLLEALVARPGEAP